MALSWATSCRMGAYLVRLLRPEQLLIDLVKMVSGRSSSGAYEGICW